MFNYQECRVNRSQGLKKEKEGTFKNLGLVAAQCNGIAACAYSLKIFTENTLLYLAVPYYTWSVVLHKTSFIFCFDKRAQNDPVWGRLLQRPLLFSFENGLVSCLVWSRVLCACWFVFRFDSLDIIGGDASLNTGDNATNRYRSASVWHFCLQPNIRDKINREVNQLPADIILSPTTNI